MVWPNRSPIPEGRRGVIPLFKLFLSTFNTPRGKGGGVGTHRDDSKKLRASYTIFPLQFIIYVHSYSHQLASTVQMFSVLQFYLFAIFKLSFLSVHFSSLVPAYFWAVLFACKCKFCSSASLLQVLYVIQMYVNFSSRSSVCSCTFIFCLPRYIFQFCRFQFQFQFFSSLHFWLLISILWSPLSLLGFELRVVTDDGL